MAKAESYTSTAKWLHWGMALLWIGAWFIGILATHWRDEFNAHHELTFLHKAMASTLLFFDCRAYRMAAYSPRAGIARGDEPVNEAGGFLRSLDALRNCANRPTTLWLVLELCGR